MISVHEGKGYFDSKLTQTYSSANSRTCLHIFIRDCVANLLGYGFDVDNIVGVISTDHVEEVSQIGQCMYSKGYITEGKKFMDPIHLFALILLNGVMALNHQYQQK